MVMFQKEETAARPIVGIIRNIDLYGDYMLQKVNRIWSSYTYVQARLLSYKEWVYYNIPHSDVLEVSRMNGYNWM